ncbi:MAG: COX15/CtaA family protein [Verrucomicrobiota bacterium]
MGTAVTTKAKSSGISTHASVGTVHRIALIGSVATFFLIIIGGLVTSKGVGMSVPDWPTTYGYNMFLFPYSKWVGGIFWEHSHRLLASGIGLITLVLAGVTFWKEKRSWVKWLAVAAVLGVIAQGILGGLRVTLYKDQIGIFHAALAQSFFGLLLVITAVTGREFLCGSWFSDKVAASLRWLVLAGLILTYFQLGVAATIRHQHAPLAIRDFPTALGTLIPDTSDSALARINGERANDQMAPVSASQIYLQLLHRAGAVVLLLIVISTALLAVARTPLGHWIRAWSLLWVGAILLQVLLGAITIWSNKAADVATSHMALGALLTAFGILFTFRLFCAASELPDPSHSAGVRS